MSLSAFGLSVDYIVEQLLGIPALRAFSLFPGILRGLDRAEAGR